MPGTDIEAYAEVAPEQDNIEYCVLINWERNQRNLVDDIWIHRILLPVYKEINNKR